MVTARAYLWIAAGALAIAGCNSIFGLDDESSFEPPPPPPPGDGSLKTCLVDPFDTLTSEWEVLDPSRFPVTVANGEVVLDIGGAGSNVINGLASTRTYDLTNGSLEARISDRSMDANVEGGISVKIDDRNEFQITDHNGEVALYYFSTNLSGSQMQAGLSDRVFRLRHEEVSGMMFFETAPDVGEPFTVRMNQFAPPIKEVTIRLFGRLIGPGGGDVVTLDDVTVTAVCP